MFACSLKINWLLNCYRTIRKMEKACRLRNHNRRKISWTELDELIECQELYFLSAMLYSILFFGLSTLQNNWFYFSQWYSIKTFVLLLNIPDCITYTYLWTVIVIIVIITLNDISCITSYHVNFKFSHVILKFSF